MNDPHSLAEAQALRAKACLLAGNIDPLDPFLTVYSDVVVDLFATQRTPAVIEQFWFHAAIYAGSLRLDDSLREKVWSKRAKVSFAPALIFTLCE